MRRVISSEGIQGFAPSFSFGKEDLKGAKLQMKKKLLSVGYKNDFETDKISYMPNFENIEDFYGKPNQKMLHQRLEVLYAGLAWASRSYRKAGHVDLEWYRPPDMDVNQVLRDKKQNEIVYLVSYNFRKLMEKIPYGNRSTSARDELGAGLIVPAVRVAIPESESFEYKWKCYYIVGCLTQNDSPPLFKEKVIMVGRPESPKSNNYIEVARLETMAGHRGFNDKEPSPITALEKDMVVCNRHHLESEFTCHLYRLTQVLLQFFEAQRVGTFNAVNILLYKMLDEQLVYQQENIRTKKHEWCDNFARSQWNKNYGKVHDREIYGGEIPKDIYKTFYDKAEANYFKTKDAHQAEEKRLSKVIVFEEIHPIKSLYEHFKVRKNDTFKSIRTRVKSLVSNINEGKPYICDPDVKEAITILIKNPELIDYIADYEMRIRNFLIDRDGKYRPEADNPIINRYNNIYQAPTSNLDGFHFKKEYMNCIDLELINCFEEITIAWVDFQREKPSVLEQLGDRYDNSNYFRAMATRQMEIISGHEVSALETEQEIIVLKNDLEEANKQVGITDHIVRDGAYAINQCKKLVKENEELRKELNSFKFPENEKVDYDEDTEMAEETIPEEGAIPELPNEGNPPKNQVILDVNTAEKAFGTPIHGVKIQLTESEELMKTNALLIVKCDTLTAKLKEFEECTTTSPTGDVSELLERNEQLSQQIKELTSSHETEERVKTLKDKLERQIKKTTISDAKYRHNQQYSRGKMKEMESDLIEAKQDLVEANGNVETLKEIEKTQKEHISMIQSKLEKSKMEVERLGMSKKRKLTNQSEGGQEIPEFLSYTDFEGIFDNTEIKEKMLEKLKRENKVISESWYHEMILHFIPKFLGSSYKYPQRLVDTNEPKKVQKTTLITMIKMLFKLDNLGYIVPEIHDLKTDDWKQCCHSIAVENSAALALHERGGVRVDRHHLRDELFAEWYCRTTGQPYLPAITTWKDTRVSKDSPFPMKRNYLDKIRPATREEIKNAPSRFESWLSHDRKMRVLPPVSAIGGLATHRGKGKGGKNNREGNFYDGGAASSSWQNPSRRYNDRKMDDEDWYEGRKYNDYKRHNN